MIQLIHSRIIAFLAIAVLAPGLLHGQELIVEPTDGENGPFLNEVIAGDTTASGERNDPDRVYVLRRDGTYLTNDDILIEGFTFRMKAEDGAGARPIIYPVTNTETGGFPDPIVDMRGDVWIQNVVMTGYTDAIPEEVANINSTIIRPNAPGFDLTLDGVVMSNTRGQHIRTQAAAREVKITNCIFANMGDLGRSNFGAGKAIDLRDGSVDTLLMQNNTFVNFQDRIIRHRSSTAPINHLIFDHNTVINGMSYHGMIALGWTGDDAAITNNLFLDAYVLGADLNDESRQAEYEEHGELFDNGNPSMPWIFAVPNDSTDWTVSGNYYATSQAVADFYAEWANDGVLGTWHPLSDDIMTKAGGTPFTEVDLEVADRPNVMINMAEWYRTETGLTKETTNFVREDDDFDRRPVTYFTGDFDASYPTDNAAYTGAGGGFPAGDLNWFPDKKAEWEMGPGPVELVPLIVEPTDGENGPFLQEVIAGDTTSTGERAEEGRVYVLRRDGIYLTNDDILIEGFTFRMMAEDGAGARPIIYPVTNTETGGFPDPIVDMRGDVWIKNVVMTGYTDAIPEEVANINSTIIRPNAPGFDLTLDGVVMSNTRGQHIRTQAAAREVKITNSLFANMGDLGRSNFGAGKAIDLRDGSVDTLLMQNNTFVNFQDRIIRHRSSTASINHLIFDHNTVINGMSYHGMIALGWTGEDAAITNNLFLDAYVLGADLNDASRQAEYEEHGELFDNGNPSMPWIFAVPNDSTDWTVSGNYYATSQAVEDFYAEWANDGVLGAWHPLSDDIMTKAGGTPFTEVDLEVGNRPDVMINMAEWYRTETGLTKETTNFVREDDDFDRRPVTYFTGDFDASYPTDNAAYTGAEDGYPAGDLNWFPDKKADWEMGVGTAIERDPTQVPDQYALEQNYPNPFNPTTSITYSIPEATKVSLVIYNVLGNEVARLVDSESQNAGAYRVTWDGTNGAGSVLASGMYIYQLQTAEATVTKRMLLLK